MPKQAVSRHRYHKTGVVIEVWRTEDLRHSDDAAESKPWITRCVDHAEICFHETEELAVEAACDPVIVCRTCFWIEDRRQGPGGARLGN